MIKIKCIKEDCSITLGQVYEVAVDLNDALHHIYKYGTAKDSIVTLFGHNDLSLFDPNEYAMSDWATLKYEDYVADDFSCWYKDEWFKDHFVIL